MKNIDIITVNVEAKMGTSLSDCIRDCIELSAKQNQDVVLTHNDKAYTVNVRALIAAVEEA